MRPIEGKTTREGASEPGGDRVSIKKEKDQKQTRSSTPGQPKRMTNVLRKVIAIAILAINGKGSVVVDSIGSLRRRTVETPRSNRVIAKTAASQAQNNPTL